MSSHPFLRCARVIAVAPLVLLPMRGVARADTPDVPAETTSRPIPVGRSWTYLDDPRLPAPLQAVVLSRATYTDSGASVTRPFASNAGTPGGALELGGEVGLAPRLALVASGVAGEAQAGGTAHHFGGIAGLRLSLLPAAWTASRLVASAGYVRDLDGGSGAWTRLTGTQDVGRLRLGGSLHAERIVGGARDAADLMVTAGASFDVAPWARLGVEYVGQDLEEALGDGAEGGARHFVGPTVAALLGDRVSLVGGPAFGLSAQSPRFVGRAALAYSF